MNKVKNLLAASIVSSLVFSSVGLAQDSNAIYPRNLSNISNLIQADIKSERVPAGTIFKLKMETPINSYNTTLGDTFRATLLEDVRIGTKVIIPAGTIVRGRAGEVKRNSYLSRGGKLSLVFDHIVTPIGKQIPLNVKINNARYLIADGTLSAGGGYLNALNNNIEQGSDFIISSTEYGINAGKTFFKGYPVIVTAPLGAAVGVTGAAGIFAVKSTVALFKKGDNVKINPGDVVELILKEPIDIPIN